jgi:hypothetical protein
MFQLNVYWIYTEVLCKEKKPMDKDENGRKTPKLFSTFTFEIRKRKRKR